jgi:hypothetical protein
VLVPLYGRAIDEHKNAQMNVIGRYGRKKPRKTPRLPNGNSAIVLLRYLGSCTGETTWIGDETGAHYKFSSDSPEGYVYEPDVQWFVELKDKKERAIFERVREK